MAMNKRWQSLPASERKVIVIDTLRALSKDGDGVSMKRFDNQKPGWLPSAQYCVKNLFRNWPEANTAAGLKPLRSAWTRRTPPTEDEMERVVEGMSKAEVLNEHKRPLIVKANDAGQPYRYWDPVNLCYHETIVHRGGHFGHAAPP